MAATGSSFTQHFATSIYRAELARSAPARRLNDDLHKSCWSIAEADVAGQSWCADNGYQGYTSYASLNDLTWRDPAFAALGKAIDPHVAHFARALDFDLAGEMLQLDSLWINILEPGGHHAAHIHPHSAVSGTYYVAVPDGASAIRFEDPRLALMMAAPPRKSRSRAENRTFVSIAPRQGTLLLWESWLRHEVPVNTASDARISISFNYRWR